MLLFIKDIFKRFIGDTLLIEIVARYILILSKEIVWDGGVGVFRSICVSLFCGGSLLLHKTAVNFKKQGTGLCALEF